MHDMNDFADALSTEALAEIAESFFGERSDIDQEKELFRQGAERLGARADAALRSAALLHALLLDSDAAPEFYTRIGVPSARYCAWVDPEQARLPRSVPGGLTARRRFRKLFLAAYQTTWEQVDAYLNGRYFNDPEQPGRKRLSMHYNLLRDWAGHINRRIRNVNEGRAPSCVLGFARHMDTMAEKYADIAGAQLDDYACSLDQDMALEFVDMAALGVKELPELPAPTSVEPELRAFADTLFHDHRAELDAILARLKALPTE